jgi:formate dehydrogenase major subunit
MVQLLLGNIGRPGGGILALRGHATIHGSTDIATLYNLHPGYLNTPSVQRKHDTLSDYIATETTPTAFRSNFPKYIVSQLKAWYGDAATSENQFGYDWLPKIVADHSHMPMFVEMSKGMLAMGQNPAVGGQHASFQRQALAQLDWLVLRDLFETETASFWKDSPEVQSGALKTADIKTEVFFLPAAAVPEMDGSFTNTQRLVQWHDKAVDPPGEARSDIWFTVHLGLRLKKLYAGSTNPRDQGFVNLTWDYIDMAENAAWRLKDEPSARRIMQEINGYTWADKKPLASFTLLKDDGSTACGAWIYTGIYAPTPEHPEGVNRAESRTSDDWVALGWGFAWPANRRILYNRAAADPAGNPWPKEVRSNGVGIDFHDGASPFIMKSDGKAWLFAPTGLVDGPLPTHYEPYESPGQNPVYTQQRNPVAKVWEPKEMLAAVGSKEYPHILSTYRLTEHHLSGSMSRWLPWLAELQPALFVEISPERAEELGIRNTEVVRVSTPRGSIQAKTLVTKRVRPYTVNGQKIHHVGMPWHWGYKGIAVGEVVNNLSALVGDPNVSIHEAKVFVCNVSKVRVV